MTFIQTKIAQQQKFLYCCFVSVSRLLFQKNLNCKIIFQPPLIQSSLSRVCIPPQRHKNMKFVYVKPKNLLNFIAKDTMGSAFVSVCFSLCFVSIFLSYVQMCVCVCVATSITTQNIFVINSHEICISPLF